MINSTYFRNLIAPLSFIIILSTSFCIYGANSINLKDSTSIDICNLMLFTTSPIKTADSKYNKFSISLNNSYSNKLSTTTKSSEYRYKKKKTKIGRWISKYPWELFYSAVALGTGITAGVLNSKAKKQEEKEQSLYNAYLNAGKDSDFNKLWNDYLDANDKTHKLVKVRRIFSLSTGGICIAIYMSFTIGSNYDN